MLIFGASGHAKVIIEALISQNEAIEGIFDDNLSIIDLLGYKNMGKYQPNFKKSSKIIIAVGNNSIRKRLVSELKHDFGNAVHISAIISQHINMGYGNVVMAGSIIQADTQIGNHCIINTGSQVDHDCVIENFVHIAPNTTLCGGVFVGEGTLLGAGSIVIPAIKIGKNVTVGAGSVVIKDIPDNAIVVGNPARIIRIINE